MSKKIHVISMPKWGMEMSEGTVLKWHVAEGETISEEMDLVDIETSKIINTISAHQGGMLSRILAREGETLLVGAPLAIQAESGVSDEQVDRFIRSLTDGLVGGPDDGGQVSQDIVEKVADDVEPTSVLKAGGAEGERYPRRSSDDFYVSPVARRLAKAYGVTLSGIQGTGRKGRISKADVEKAAGHHPHRADESAVGGQDSAVKITPVAKRLADSLGIAVADCRASGRHGRIAKADVEAAALAKKEATAARNSTPPEPAAGSPLSGMRKTIAEKLTLSKQNAPHFRVNLEVNVEKLLKLRKAMNEMGNGAQLSINDFLIKACAASLKNSPEINVQFDGSSVYRFGSADISVAVALDEGLVTPIVRQAESKGLLAISKEVADLIGRAKLGKLKPDEYRGGTFTLSNLGMFGVSSFDAIINSPQCAILAVGAAEKRPVVKKGKIAAQTMLRLSLSCDHRVIDGATAARFMASLKNFIEHPALMLA